MNLCLCVLWIERKLHAITVREICINFAELYRSADNVKINEQNKLNSTPNMKRFEKSHLKIEYRTS